MHAKVALLAAAAAAFAPPPSQPQPSHLHAASIALEEESPKPVRGVRRAARLMRGEGVEPLGVDGGRGLVRLEQLAVGARAAAHLPTQGLDRRR